MQKNFVGAVFAEFASFHSNESRSARRILLDQMNNLSVTLILFNINHLFAEVGRVFANGPGDLGSIPGRVIPKTSKTVLDTSLLNTQQ